LCYPQPSLPMKFVDGIVPNHYLPTQTQSTINAKVTVSYQEYLLIQQVFQQILKNSGILNPQQQEQFEQVKALIPRFCHDWRYKELEKQTKELLLKELLSLNATTFLDLFPSLQIFLRETTVQSLFDQLYIALSYSKLIQKIYELDFVTRIYLEKMLQVFELLKPFLTQSQIDKWQQNIAPKLKRF